MCPERCCESNLQATHKKVWVWLKVCIKHSHMVKAGQQLHALHSTESGCFLRHMGPHLEHRELHNDRLNLFQGSCFVSGTVCPANALDVQAAFPPLCNLVIDKITRLLVCGIIQHLSSAAASWRAATNLITAIPSSVLDCKADSQYLNSKLVPGPVHLTGRVNDGLAHSPLIEHGQLHGDPGEAAASGVDIHLWQGPGPV